MFVCFLFRTKESRVFFSAESLGHAQAVVCLCVKVSFFGREQIETSFASSFIFMQIKLNFI